MKFANIIRDMIDHELMSLKELIDITHHDGSMIYRWLNGECEPDFDDMRHIANQLPNPETKRNYIRLLTHDLDGPTEVSDDSHDDMNGHGPQDIPDTLARTILALVCLTNLLTTEHEAIQDDSMKTDSKEHFAELFDEARQHLMHCHDLLVRTRTDS